MMKKKILIISLVLIMTGTVALGFDIIKLTPDEAYESASEINIQAEIDELYHELKQISYDKSIKEASYTPVNTYQGRLKKFVYPFDAETSLKVSEMNLERSEKLLMVDIFSTAVSTEESILAYNDTVSSYEEAVSLYNDAKNNSAITTSELLSLEYTAENNRIKMIQAKNNMERLQGELDSMLGVENASVDIPMDYRTPYEIDSDDVIESMMKTDISLHQARRSYTSAQMRFEIAEELFDEDEETYISALASLKTAELNYEKKKISVEISAINKVDVLKTLFDSIELEKLNLRIKKELFDASQKQYDAGIISVKSLENVEFSYNLAKRQLDSKIYDYIIAAMQFEIDTGYSF